MTGPIFLAGGGSSEQSFQVDRAFAQRCKSALPVVYIPTALRSQPADACLEWFRRAMGPHGIDAIEMWPDLQAGLAVTQIGGIYVGGGDTLFLHRAMLEAGFDSYLRAALAAGVPVYGGSAGAIVLGERLGGSRRMVAAGQDMTPGLGLVGGYAVTCHFEAGDEDRLQEWSVATGVPVIAIPETAGVVVEGGQLLNLGASPVRVIDPLRVVSLSSGDMTGLATGSGFPRSRE